MATNEKLHLESNGRTLILDDDGIKITPNRLDMLEISHQIYGEYVKENVSINFRDWLIGEMLVEKAKDYEES